MVIEVVRYPVVRYLIELSINRQSCRHTYCAIGVYAPPEFPSKLQPTVHLSSHCVVYLHQPHFIEARQTSIHTAKSDRIRLETITESKQLLQTPWSSLDPLNIIIPATMIDTNTNSPSRTPNTSPPKKTMRITQVQKQALIDNLQLESKSLPLPNLPSIYTEQL